MKYRLAMSLVAAAALTPPVLAYAATEGELFAASSPVLASSSNSSRRFVPSGRAVVTIDGRPINFQGQFFFQIGGRFLVPLRPIGQALGARVNYNPATSTVTASRAGYQLNLRGGAYNIGGTTLVPLRTLGESLGVHLTVSNTAGLTKIAINSTPTGHAGVTIISRPSPSAPAQPPTTFSGGTTASTTQDATSASIQYNLNQLNVLRARAGAPPLKLDARLNAFAREGSLVLMRTHEPHGHFRSADVWNNGFERAAAENQGDPHGWFPGPVNQSIDQILKAMMDEGPGGGHHDNIINAAYRRVGIGLVKDSAGRLYFTNDFSG